jgi:hypothetical protein
LLRAYQRALLEGLPTDTRHHTVRRIDGKTDNKQTIRPGGNAERRDEHKPILVGLLLKNLRRNIHACLESARDERETRASQTSLSHLISGVSRWHAFEHQSLCSETPTKKRSPSENHSRGGRRGKGNTFWNPTALRSLR